MRLQPVQPTGGNGADIEPVDVHCVRQRLRELFVGGDAAADQCGTNLRQHLVLRTLDNRREREHVFFLGNRIVRRGRLLLLLSRLGG